MTFLNKYKAQIVSFTLMFYYAVSLPWLTKYTPGEMAVMQKLRLFAYALLLMLAFDTVYQSIRTFRLEANTASVFQSVLYWTKEHLLFVLLCIVSICIFLASSHLQPLIFLVTLTAVSDTGFDRHIQKIFIVHILFMILTIALFRLGIKEQVVISRNGTDMIRQSLGYIYPLDFHGHFFFLVLMYIYIRKEAFRFSEFLFVNLANVLMFIFTDARNDTFMVFLASAMAVSASYLNREKIVQRIHLKACAVYTCFLTILPFVLSFAYTRQNSFLKKMNSILSGRLRVAHDVLTETGIPLFGKYMDWIGSGFTGNGMEADYNWIDFSFVKDTIDYGLVFEILFTIGFIYMFYHVLKKKDVYGVIMTAVLLLSSLLEYHTFMPYTYPLTLMMCGGVLCRNRDLFFHGVGVKNE